MVRPWLIAPQQESQLPFIREPNFSGLRGFRVFSLCTVLPLPWNEIKSGKNLLFSCIIKKYVCGRQVTLGTSGRIAKCRCRMEQPQMKGQCFLHSEKMIITAGLRLTVLREGVVLGVGVKYQRSQDLMWLVGLTGL